MQDIDDQLGYDADHDDPRQYCQHGTFIGSWWGPDYLCGACEEGIPVVLDRYWKLKRAATNAEQHGILRWMPVIDHITAGMTYNAGIATAITVAVLNDADQIADQLRYVRRCKARVRHYRWLHRDQIARELAQWEAENA